MLDEVLEGLRLRPGAHVIDATLGGGGHTAAILDRIGPEGRVLGIDQDPDALARTREKLSGYGDRLITAHGNFEELQALARDHGFLKVDGVLMDLGVSSDQLDRAERGFSFRFDGPLDMRMNPSQGLPVSEWLQQTDEREFIQVLREYGEERFAKRIATAVLTRQQERPFTMTADLAAVVEKAVPAATRGRIHPATRTFQALRMAVNRELDVLREGLEGAIHTLSPGGRLVVISFHSLEDRLVKQTLQRHIGRDVALEAGGSEWVGDLPRLNRVSRKPVTASDEECERNPRSRSAKTRIAERAAE